MNKIHVVNKRDHAPTDKDFYVGRGSVFGNPYTSKPLDKSKAIYQVKSRNQAIRKYSLHLNTQTTLKNEKFVDGLNKMLEALKQNDIYLVCYCAPKTCHGDVIKNKLISMIIEDLMPK